MQLVLSRNAQKQYNHLPVSEQKKLKKKLFNLQDDPYIGKKLEGELSGYRSARVWPYRIIYQINEGQKRVEVEEIIHRQGAYK